jgi:hypothetical protein
LQPVIAEPDVDLHLKAFNETDRAAAGLPDGHLSY